MEIFGVVSVVLALVALLITCLIAIHQASKATKDVKDIRRDLRLIATVLTQPGIEFEPIEDPEGLLAGLKAFITAGGHARAGSATTEGSALQRETRIEVLPQLLKKAGRHCASMNKELEITDLMETEGPYVLGKYPRVEIKFVCR